MPVKFNQYWRVLRDARNPYRNFIIKEFESFLPLMEAMKIQVAGEWEVLIGDGPRIILEGRIRDAGSLINDLQSAGFRRGKQELCRYVENYESRLLGFHIKKTRGYKSASYQMVPE